jgi:hypothetical protein
MATPVRRMVIDSFPSASLASVKARERAHIGRSRRRGMAEPENTERAARSDRSPWNWLLLVGIVVPLVTPLFNHDSPRIAGFPLFYWLQFLFILLGVTCTGVVYRMTRR